MDRTENLNEKNPEISIIVPVYNVGKYLFKSLESIKNQSFKDWECIIIDDGSTDNSPEICDQFGKEDPRFKIFHQTNGGVSRARNAGLDKAKGKYIAFVDPDDWVETSYLETFYSLIIKYDADVVQCGFIREFTSFIHEKHLTNKLQILNHEEAAPLLLSSNGIPSLLWSKLYKRDIITERFPEGKTYEDAYTMPRWFVNVNKIVLSPELTYHYRMRKGSITKIGVAENHYDYVNACVRLADTVHEMIPSKFNGKDYYSYIYNLFISGAKTIARKEKDIAKRREVILRISKRINETENPGFSALGLKIWFRSFLLKSHPKAFETLMRGVNKLDFYSKRRRAHLFE